MIRALAVLSRQKHPDFGRGLQIPYYPAQSVYQPPGQAIFSKSKSNNSFIKAMSNGIFIWPFYEGRSSQVARHPDFGRGLQSPYYPAQSVYQRPGQAIFSKSRSNSSFIKARSNGRFIKALAVYHGRSSQVAKHPDLSRGLRIPHHHWPGQNRCFIKSFLDKTAIGGLPGLDKTAIGFDKAAIALDKTASCIRAVEEAL